MMKQKTKVLYLPYVVGILALAAIAWWLFSEPPMALKTAVPGMDNRDSASINSAENVDIGAYFIQYAEAKPVPGTRWPCFRGAERDNISMENIPLIDQFGPDGPDILWTMEVGEGHAAPAVYDGLVYLMDYHEQKKRDMLRCLDLQTGKELWRRSYKVHLKRNHGLSRTVPAVNEDVVVTMGPKCQVMAVDRLSGAFLWGLDLVADYGVEVPFWYTGQCPLLLHDTLVLAVGGKNLMMGLEAKTGKILWETPSPDHWKMSHASVATITINGKKMFVYPAIGGICGVSASGKDTGTLLWSSTEFGPSVAAPTPVPLGDGKIFLTAGYGYGGMVIQVVKEGNEWRVRTLQKYAPSKGLASEQQTPILANGCLFSIMPKDGGGWRNEFVCVHPDDCQKPVYRSGKTHRFGLGPYILADGKFFIINDDGQMTIARFSTNRFQVLDQAQILDGQDSWGPIALTGGYLLMRDTRHLLCINVKKGS
jgi:outer membrane protein assembly factor BamB